MSKKPYIVLKGARVEIDGVDILVIRTPFKAADPEKITKQLCSLRDPVVLASQEPDGTFCFSGHPSYAAKLQAKIGVDFQWTNISVSE